MSVNREGLEKLAPCECGRPAKLQGTQIVEGRATRWYARCELATCWFGPERDSPERAAESWNRRALLAEAREEGKPLEKSEGQKATEWSQRPTREWEPPASAGTEGPGLREALEKVTVRMNKVTARWRHTRSIAKAEMDALCNIQLEAEAALARLEGEKK